MKRASNYLTATATLFLALGLVTMAAAQLEDRDGDGVIECCEEGDIICGVGNGLIEQRDPNTGNLIRLINTGSGSNEDTGMCFDANGDMLSTNFTTSTMSKIDMSSDPVNTNLCGQLIQHPFAGPFNSHDESCVFDGAGDFYVGQADGSRDILKFDASGALLDTFNPATGPRGTDWIDLAADQCTIYYTSEGQDIRRFDVCTNTQLPNFATGLVTGRCFGLRIIPAGPFAGEVIVACTNEAVRVDTTGAIVQRYPNSDCPGTSFFFAMNLDPNGTTFWTMDIGNGKVCEYDIATAAPARSLTCQRVGASTAGLTVCGELTAALTASLTPELDFNPPGTDHTVTLQITGSDVEGIAVDFLVLSGPNGGEFGSDTSDADGIATFTYTGSGGIGVDRIQATFDVPEGLTVFESNIALKFWDEDCQPNDIPDTCDIDCGGFDGDCAEFAGCGGSADTNGDGVPDECNMPPVCVDAAADPDELWPPNHKFRDIAIVGVVDPDGDPVMITITDISQDEPLNGLGDGNTCPDGTGVGTSTARVRAERTGTPKVPGDGRVYHIGFEAEDGNGGECMGTVTVCVPHDQRPGHVCVDGGPLFDSTVCD
ncbi:MAG: hypothetical protein OES32_11295 [Acidobacteriota bacterium]|nr:hypothetical protein [Acidobacteriota bacterium]